MHPYEALCSLLRAFLNSAISLSVSVNLGLVVDEVQT